MQEFKVLKHLDLHGNAGRAMERERMMQEGKSVWQVSSIAFVCKRSKRNNIKKVL